MNIKLKIILVVVTIIAGCHCEKKTVETKPVDAPKAQVPSDDIQALNNLVVSFYSKGSGINREGVGKLEKFITDYSKRTNTQISYKKVGWGKEGEADYCISLSVMNNEQRSKFIASVNDILRSVETVHLFENRPCRDMK
jgi:hypothetical protein